MHKVDDGTKDPLPRNLDVALLELFECIRRTKNLSAAGQQMGLSQPAVSRGVARLREMYGDALFIRRPRGVEPTPFAEALAAPVASALQTLRSTFSRPFFDPGTEARGFRIAMSDIGERLFLPRLLEEVSHSAPHVRVEAVSPALGQIEQALASGEVDLAVGYLGGLGKQFHRRKLFRERFVYIAREGHPDIHGALKREQLRSIPHVVAGPTGMQHAIAVEKVLAGPRVKARTSLRVHSFLCVGPVVNATNLIGAVPSNLAAVVAGHMRLQVIESPVQFPGFDVEMAWHQRFHREPGIEWLRGAFVALFSGGFGPPP